MITDLGHLSAWIALLMCVVAALASARGAHKGDDRWVQSGRVAAALTFPLLLLAVTGLWVALMNHDFGVKYVAGVSSLSTPLAFRLTALWGSQNGSILFWCLIMSAFIFFAVNRDWARDRVLLPHVTTVMCGVLGFFIAINLTQANPFMRSSFPPADGQGLNPLLRHPGMIIHPPVLYAGFTGFIVPFAFCLASLIARRGDNVWLQSSRRWTLVGWAFLSSGLLLGGRWAHDVLGWGGYWGWDPVENKSLVPWLLGTAFLHSAMIQEKRGMLKNWNVFLMLLTFVSIIWSTAVVRSGVLTSVHAFAQSTLGPLFLAFIVLMCAVCLYFWFTRLNMLESERKFDSPFSREGIFVIQNMIFLSSALTVFIGTTLPIITEAINGSKLTVGPPFYDKVVVPQFLLLVLLMGIAPLMAWGRANARALGRFALAPMLAALLVAAVLIAWSIFNAQVSIVNLVLSPLAIAICIYALTQTVLEYGRGAIARAKTTGEGRLIALGKLFQRNPQRYGGYLIHIGVVLLALGAAGKGFYGRDVVRNVDLNSSFAVGDYSFTYRGLRPEPCDFDDCRTITAGLRVARNGSFMADVFPHRDIYERQQHTASIAATAGTFNEEVYVILSAWEGTGENASFQVYINPMINWIWLGGCVAILGFFIAFWPHDFDPRAPAAARKLAASAVARALPIVFAAGACLVLFAAGARAQASDPATDEPTYRVAKQLNCPTCAGRNLADCPTETCMQWKGEIRDQLRAGKSPQDVLAYFETRFGAGVLQEPPRSGVSLLLWALPVLALGLLLMGGALFARRSSSIVEGPVAQSSALSDYVDAMEQQVRDA